MHTDAMLHIRRYAASDGPACRQLVVLRQDAERRIEARLRPGEKRHARDGGASELRIGVRSENRAARRMYIREGFAPYLDTLYKSLTGADLTPLRANDP
jgi:hypothetical protein